MAFGRNAVRIHIRVAPYSWYSVDSVQRVEKRCSELALVSRVLFPQNFWLKRVLAHVFLASAMARKQKPKEEAPVATGNAYSSAATLAEARDGEAGHEPWVASAASFDAAGAASFPKASADAEMPAVASPPVVVAPRAGTQPNHLRAKNTA
jgi:hypothetical protein